MQSCKHLEIMTTNHHKQTIIRYIDASISGTIASKQIFIPGVGLSPDPDAHAWDLINWYLTFMKRGQVEFAEQMLNMVDAILEHFNKS